MRRIAILGALGLVTALVSGCALDVGENLPAPGEEPTGKDEQAFDASLFKFGTVVPDDGHDPSGGSQRAIATLNFWDGRDGFFGKRWTCLVSVWLPLRLNYVSIPPDRAAEMSAIAADAARSARQKSGQTFGPLLSALRADDVRLAAKQAGSSVLAKGRARPYGASRAPWSRGGDNVQEIDRSIERRERAETS